MENKIIWVMTINRDKKTAKVTKCKKGLSEIYASVLANSQADIMSWTADIYISYNHDMLYELAKKIFEA